MSHYINDIVADNRMDWLEEHHSNETRVRTDLHDKEFIMEEIDHKLIKVELPLDLQKNYV